MRYHRHLFITATEALSAIFFEDRYADKCIEYYLRKNRKWGSRDRRFFAETVYDCVRWWSLYWELLAKPPTSDIFSLIGVSLHCRGLEIPDFSDYKDFDTDLIDKRRQSIKEVHVQQAIPKWLHEFALKDLGESWLDNLSHLNTPNALVIRVNAEKIQPENLQRQLQKDDIQAEPLSGTSSGLIIRERKNVFRTEAFKKGFFEVQDGSSQQVADFLDVKPGQRVIDACAGAGGKTLHIASLLQNRGKVIAMDIHQYKLDQLKIRSRRSGVSVVEPREISSSKVIKRLYDSADRLLLDVPCSGVGVLRRNPDTKWKLTEDRVKELCEIQKDILNRYSRMVKPGGKMLYATCSIFRCENEDQVENFLSENSGWKILKQRRIYPNRLGFDGFYMCLMEKEA